MPQPACQPAYPAAAAAPAKTGAASRHPAGWWRDARGVALFLVIVLGAKLLWHAAARHLAPAAAPSGQIAPLPAFLFEALMLTVVGGATALLARIEARPLTAYGLAAARPVAHALAGLLAGLACLLSLAGVMLGLGFLRIDGFAIGIAQIPVYGAAWLVIFAMVGLGEEMLFRGYLQTTLTRRLGFWPASMAGSLFFAAMHMGNQGETPAGIAGVVLGGAAFCLLLRASGSLWAGIGFHTSWDWAQSFLLGTADSGTMMQGHMLISHPAGDIRFSGGTAGPEASLLAAPMFLCGVCLLAWAMQRAQR